MKSQEQVEQFLRFCEVMERANKCLPGLSPLYSHTAHILKWVLGRVVDPPDLCNVAELEEAVSAMEQMP